MEAIKKTCKDIGDLRMQTELFGDLCGKGTVLTKTKREDWWPREKSEQKGCAPLEPISCVVHFGTFYSNPGKRGTVMEF